MAKDSDIPKKKKATKRDEEKGPATKSWTYGLSEYCYDDKSEEFPYGYYRDTVGRRTKLDEHGHIVRRSSRPPLITPDEWKKASAKEKKGLLEHLKDAAPTYKYPKVAAASVPSEEVTFCSKPALKPSAKVWPRTPIFFVGHPNLPQPQPQCIRTSTAWPHAEQNTNALGSRLRFSMLQSKLGRCCQRGP